jgi:hydroxymethylbilane synthase
VTRILRLGTRRSKLALAQSRSVADRLGELGHEVELVPIVTDGDLGNGRGGVGAFVTALERALVEGRVDIAVHSAKDVPLRSLDVLAVAAYPERADPRDALVARRGMATLADLPAAAAVGTDSPRRAGFLLSWRPDLRVRPLSGNVDTRLRRLEAGEVDVLVLAAAGLDRLGLAHRVDLRLEPEVMPPAPGQGALAVQCRVGDAATAASLARLDDAAIRLAVTTERLVLEATGGTCRSPVGAVARVVEDRLRLLAGAAALDGATRHVVDLETDATEPAARRLAAEAGRQLLEKVVTLVG